MSETLDEEISVVFTEKGLAGFPIMFLAEEIFRVGPGRVADAHAQAIQVLLDHFAEIYGSEESEFIAGCARLAAKGEFHRSHGT